MIIKSSISKLVTVVILTIALTSCAGMFSESLVHANRQPIIKTPKDYGMEYIDIDIKTPDNLNLKGWLIPGERKSLAIMVHPMNFTKYGYSTKNQGTFKITDIEVEFLNTAKKLNEAGHSVLTFDLRNHGESDSTGDEVFGLGSLEWKDVIGALDYIEDNNLGNNELFFVSFCTGANATILAMKNQPERFKDIKCIAAIQPISMEVFVTSFMKDKYPLFSGMVPSIGRSIVKKGGLPYDQMSPLNYIDGLFKPVLFVQAEEDSWTDINYVKKLYNETTAPKEIFWLTGERHRFDTYNYFGHSPDRLLNFINNNLN